MAAARSQSIPHIYVYGILVPPPLPPPLPTTACRECLAMTNALSAQMVYGGRHIQKSFGSARVEYQNRDCTRQPVLAVHLLPPLKSAKHAPPQTLQKGIYTHRYAYIPLYTYALGIDVFEPILYAHMYDHMPASMLLQTSTVYPYS